MKVKELQRVLILKNKIVYKDRRSGVILKNRTIDERMAIGEREVYLIDARDENELEVLVY